MQSHPDCVGHLERVCRLSARIADVYRSNGATSFADQYDAMATSAARLLGSGFDQSDLSRLSAMTPGRPDWLNPKAADFGMPREQWHVEIAALDVAHREAALNLRVIGTV